MNKKVLNIRKISQWKDYGGHSLETERLERGMHGNLTGINCLGIKISLGMQARNKKQLNKYGKGERAR